MHILTIGKCFFIFINIKMNISDQRIIKELGERFSKTIRKAIYLFDIQM